MNLFLILSLSICVSFAAANTCGGNCPSDTCTTCDCGTTPNVVDIATWCAQYSDWDKNCCNCIAQKESAGNANAENRSSDGANNVGLWQINSVHWGELNGGNAPCDLEENLKCAIAVYQSAGNSWGPWDTAPNCGC